MHRTAIVTGAARRVGRAVALELARAGWDLVLTCRTRREEADRVAAECAAVSASAGHRSGATVAELDLDDLDAVGRFGADAASRGVDALVLNASSYERTPFGSIAAPVAERELRVNALAPLILSQAVAPALAASRLPGGGAIVAFGDIHAAGRPRRAFAPYLMSKAALHAMVEALAVELAPAVRVNAILPGVVAWPDDTPAAERESYEARIPLGRPGTPEDAARLARSIIEDMPYVTGSLIRLDGGRSLR